MLSVGAARCVVQLGQRAAFAAPGPCLLLATGHSNRVQFASTSRRLTTTTTTTTMMRPWSVRTLLLNSQWPVQTPRSPFLRARWLSNGAAGPLSSADEETVRLVMDSNRQGMGYSQQGLHREAYDCFSHALRWCPMPHEMASLATSAVAAAAATSAQGQGQGRGRPRKRVSDEDDEFPDEDEELERKLHAFQWQTRRAAVMNNLGMTCQALGRLNEAEEMLRQTIQLRSLCLDQVRLLFARETEPVVQAEQEQVALALSNARRHLASLYSTSNRAEEAIEQLGEAVAVVRSKTTPQRRGPFLALALNNLATVRIKQSLLDEQTEAHLKEAVQLLADDAKTPDLLVILKNLRHFYAKTEQAEQRDAVQKQIDDIAAKEADTSRLIQ